MKCSICKKENCQCKKQQILIEDGTMASFGLENFAEVTVNKPSK